MLDINCLQVSICQPPRLRAELTKCITNAKRPASNISKGEFKALQELKADIDITILPADKGRSTVNLTPRIMKASCQPCSVTPILIKCYRRTPRRNSRELTEMIQRWQREDPIPSPLKHFIYSRRNPQEYGLPSIHRANVPL